MTNAISFGDPQLPARFWAKVQPDPDSGCWVWTAAVANRYGQVSIGGKRHRPHRLTYETLVGPIPEGLTIDHLCRNKLCVNPRHLEPVTTGENKRRWARLITHCPAGHEYTPKNTRVNARGHRNCLQCHRENRRSGGKWGRR